MLSGNAAQIEIVFYVLHLSIMELILAFIICICHSGDPVAMMRRDTFFFNSAALLADGAMCAAD